MISNKIEHVGLLKENYTPWVFTKKDGEMVNTFQTSNEEMIHAFQTGITDYIQAIGMNIEEMVPAFQTKSDTIIHAFETAKGIQVDHSKFAQLVDFIQTILPNFPV